MVQPESAGLPFLKKFSADNTRYHEIEDSDFEDCVEVVVKDTAMFQNLNFEVHQEVRIQDHKLPVFQSVESSSEVSNTIGTEQKGTEKRLSEPFEDEEYEDECSMVEVDIPVAAASINMSQDIVKVLDNSDNQPAVPHFHDMLQKDSKAMSSRKLIDNFLSTASPSHHNENDFQYSETDINYPKIGSGEGKENIPSPEKFYREYGFSACRE